MDRKVYVGFPLVPLLLTLVDSQLEVTGFQSLVSRKLCILGCSLIVFSIDRILYVGFLRVSLLLTLVDSQTQTEGHRIAIIYISHTLHFKLFISIINDRKPYVGFPLELLFLTLSRVGPPVSKSFTRP